MNPYVLALALTLAIEVTIVALCFPGQRVRMGLVCVAATSATHLSMHFVLPRVLGSWGSAVLWGELGAVTVEAAVYAIASRPRDVGRALVAAALANLTSYAAGLALF